MQQSQGNARKLHLQEKSEEHVDYLKDVFKDNGLGYTFFETEKNESGIAKVPVDYDNVNRTLNLVKQQIITQQFPTKKDKKTEISTSAASTATSAAAATSTNLLIKEPNSTQVSSSEVKSRIQSLNPSFPTEEVLMMFPQKKEVSSKELFDLLKPNQLENDPLTEAIKLFVDPVSGEMKLSKLNAIFKALGHPIMPQKEFAILKEILDVDFDGKITEEDVKDVLSFSNQMFNETQAQLQQQQQQHHHHQQQQQQLQQQFSHKQSGAAASSMLESKRNMN